MVLNLRCRGTSGQSTLLGIETGMSVADFCALLASKTGVPPAQQEILAGFPPKLLELPADRAAAPLSSLPLISGDTIVVRELSASPAPSTPGMAPAFVPEAAAAAAAATHGVGAPPAGNSATQQQSIEDEELAAAIAASLQDGGAPVSGPCSSAPAAAAPPPLAQPCAPAVKRSAASQGASPTRAPIRGGGGACVVRRVIDSDNSCLFNAIGYVMEGNRMLASKLRQVIADAVRADPFQYNEAFLGMDNAKYCSWITSPDKWGGAIELSILSNYFRREVAAFDIQTQRMDLYGQDQGYLERVMLLYDGLHYDAMAVSPVQDGPEELDITKVEPSSSDAADIQHAAQLLVQAAHEARHFTNTASFTLRCGVCQIGLKGEKEAVQHAASSGHTTFQEY